MNSAEKFWYALRITYSRELALKNYLDTEKVENFLPMRYEYVFRGERKIRKLVPVIHNLIFVRLSRKEMDELKANPMYLEIPVMAAARFAIADNQNIVVKAGPYFGFGIAGKYKAGGEKIDFFKDTKDEDGDILMEGAKKFDAGLGVGVAYEINKFFIDLTGEFGLTKIYDGDGAPKNINFSIGVGYKF